MGVPDALAPFHLASPSERQRRTRDVLQWAWKVYARGGKSLVESVREAAAGSPVGAFALQQMRHVLLELNLQAWETHPNRTRGDVMRLLRKAIGKLAPHGGGWRATDAPRRKQNMTRDELLAHVERRSTPCPLTGCWLWTGSVTNGYARMAWGSQKSGTVTRFLLGLTPDDPREARHTCDCPPCVNPAHLVIGTHAENMRDMAERGRAATGPRGERKQGPYHPGLWRRL